MMSDQTAELIAYCIYGVAKLAWWGTLIYVAAGAVRWELH